MEVDGVGEPVVATETTKLDTGGLDPLDGNTIVIGEFAKIVPP